MNITFARTSHWFVLRIRRYIINWQMTSLQRNLDLIRRERANIAATESYLQRQQMLCNLELCDIEKQMFL